MRPFRARRHSRRSIVWPLRGSATTDFVRVGRQSAQRWSQTPQGLLHLATESLGEEEAGGTSSLLTALTALVGPGDLAAATHTSPQSHSHLILESVWLPVILVELGTSTWAADQARALVRHRLRGLYDGAQEQFNDGEVRVDFRPGDRYAVGYAVPTSVMDTVNRVASLFGLRWASLQPAFAWGWERGWARRKWPLGQGWWIWNEQDRSLVACVDDGRVFTLNSGAARCVDDADAAQAVRVETLRCGAKCDGWPMVVAGWEGK
jgi:hypothetical protein